jgi:hypothetical protein
MGKWALNVLLGLDQWANTWFGGAPDETISSRSGRAAADGKWWGRAMCWWLDKLDPGHCADAVESERQRTHLPPPLR